MKVLSNMMVDLAGLCGLRSEGALGITELVYYPVLEEITGRELKMPEDIEAMQSGEICP